MKIPIPLNDLDKAIMAFQRSQAAVPELLRQLCAGNLWLLVPFHPEVANQDMQYREGQPMPFQRIQTSKGVMVAVFSSEARALEGMKKAKVRPRTYMPAVMSARDVLGMLGKLNLAMAVNKGCSTGDISLPPQSLIRLASGAAFNPPPLDDKGSERLQLDKLNPADYPTDLVQAVFEFCRQHGRFRAVWIFSRGIAGQPAAARKAYYILVLMEPRDATLFHDFNLVAKSVSQEYEVNLSLTESNAPECIADLFRQAQPFYMAADYQPPKVSAPVGPKRGQA
jgi:hypothetical protein